MEVTILHKSIEDRAELMSEFSSFQHLNNTRGNGIIMYRGKKRNHVIMHFP
jgi:hypothetical protein